MANQVPGILDQQAIRGLRVGDQLVLLLQRLGEGDFPGDVGDLGDEEFELAPGAAQGAQGQIAPDAVAVGMDELSGHPVGVDLPGQQFQDIDHGDLEGFRRHQVLPRHRHQSACVVATQLAHGVVHLGEATIRGGQAHGDGGVVDGVAVPRLGNREALFGLVSLGGVAPGDDDVVGCGAGGPQVVAAGVQEELVVVGEVVDDQWVTGIEAADEGGQHRVLDPRRSLGDRAADEFGPRQPDVVTRRLVDLQKTEVDDPAGGVPRRCQEHTGVQQRVGTGPQHRNGRALSREEVGVVAGRGLGGHPCHPTSRYARQLRQRAFYRPKQFD